MSGGHPHGSWRLAFLLGDLLLLMTVGAVSAWTMSLAHAAVGGMWISAVLGMAIGMIGGAAIAFAARPVLGSIETSVPSMIAGMMGGMAVCSMMLVAHVTPAMAVLLGTAVSAVLHVRLRRLERRGGIVRVGREGGAS